MTTSHFITIRMKIIPNFVSIMGMGFIQFQSTIMVLVKLFIKYVIRKVTTMTKNSL